MQPSGIVTSGMTAGTGRPSTPERRKRKRDMGRPIFVQTGRCFIRSVCRFAQNRFLCVGVLIFPVSTPYFVEKTPRGEISDPSGLKAQFLPAGLRQFAPKSGALIRTQFWSEFCPPKFSSAPFCFSGGGWLVSSHFAVSLSAKGTFYREFCVELCSFL